MAAVMKIEVDATDLSTRPTFPEPVLEISADDILPQVVALVHPSQHTESLPTGRLVYEHLRSNPLLLASCLGLAEGRAIADKGFLAFNCHFDHAAVLFWKAVDDEGVLCFWGEGGKIKQGWRNLDSLLNDYDLTLVWASGVRFIG